MPIKCRKLLQLLFCCRSADEEYELEEQKIRHLQREMRELEREIKARRKELKKKEREGERKQEEEEKEEPELSAWIFNEIHEELNKLTSDLRELKKRMKNKRRYGCGPGREDAYRVKTDSISPVGASPLEEMEIVKEQQQTRHEKKEKMLEDIQKELDQLRRIVTELKTNYRIQNERFFSLDDLVLMLEGVEAQENSTEELQLNLKCRRNPAEHRQEKHLTVSQEKSLDVREINLESPVTQKISEKIFIKQSSKENQDETTDQPGSSQNTPVLIKVQALDGIQDPPNNESSQCSGSASGTKVPKSKSTTGRVVRWVNQKMKDEYQRKMEKSLRREEENGNKFYVICIGRIIQEIRVAKVEQEKRRRLNKKEKRRQELEDRFNKWEEKKLQKKTKKKEKKKQRRIQQLDDYCELWDEQESKQKAKEEKKRQKKEEKKKRKEKEKTKGLVGRWRKRLQKKIKKKQEVSQSEELPTEAQKHSEPSPAPLKCKARVIFVQPINPFPEPTEDKSHQGVDEGGSGDHYAGTYGQRHLHDLTKSVEGAPRGNL